MNLPGGARGPFTAEQDRYTADASAGMASALLRGDGSQPVDVLTGGQTSEPWQFDTFDDHGAPSTTFVVGAGHARDAVDLFRIGRADHDTLGLQRAGFSDSVAAVLRNTRAKKGGALIVHPAAGDAVKVSSVSEAQLRVNPGDIAFHD